MSTLVIGDSTIQYLEGYEVISFPGLKLVEFLQIHKLYNIHEYDNIVYSFD